MNEAQSKAGGIADALIDIEVAIQDKMWGDANERADSTKNQLVGAATAQILLVKMTLDGVPPDMALAVAKDASYPKDWDGFRSYGSPVANLVVAAAFIRSEIKRRILLGEDTTRTKRGEPYTVAAPYMSAEEAGAGLEAAIASEVIGEVKAVVEDGH